MYLCKINIGRIIYSKHGRKARGTLTLISAFTLSKYLRQLEEVPFTMRDKSTPWLLLNLVTLQLFLESSVSATSGTVKEKAEATIPITTLSLPEGNTTFLDGTTWCVARREVSPIDLQIALDWACGFGQADCHPIRAGGACFEPNTLLSHASYAFNSYYQQNGNSDIACHFDGAAALTRNNPSYERCVFPASGTSAASSLEYSRIHQTWGIIGVILLLLHLTRR